MILYEVGQVSMAINYGLDKVRFPNATPADQNLEVVFLSLNLILFQRELSIN